MIKLLVVDDQKDMRELLKDFFKQRGYEVFLAGDGNEALAKVEEIKPHLVFLDIGMPGLSGLEVLPMIKQKYPVTKVIMITAFDDAQKMEQAKSLGASDYITKPFSFEYLHTTVLNKVYAQLFEEIIKAYERLNQQTIQMVMAFNKAVDARDPYTARHSEEVCEIGKRIAEGLKIPITQDLIFSLQLHDIGKIGIPDSILLKPDKLTDEELEIIKQHPRIGFEIVGVLDGFKYVAEIIYCHQECFDGRGYPRGLKGEEIPFEARIIAVADTYHAMTSDRPYRKALPLQEAIARLKKEKGTQFDPLVVEALIRVLSSP
ncbi:MAG: response regulator [Candidatus Omnitrophica bacterium]|nr:response regulator [Candidatus Omnitrophota bacterium]